MRRAEDSRRPRRAAGPVLVPEQGLPGSAADRALAAPLLHDPRVDTVVIPASILRRRVAALARALRAQDPTRHTFDFVVVLNGAVFFAMDLGAQLFRQGGALVRYHFVKASTYGTAIKGQGESERAVAVEVRAADLRGLDVVLVEDLVDQGFTLTKLRQVLLEEAGVRSVTLCVLLEKELAQPTQAVQQMRAALRPELVGFRVPDRWVAGYGIDAGGDFRNLPCIVTVQEAHYR